VASNELRVPLIAGWWAKSSDGGIRRLWVNRQGSFYDCRLELCTEAQDEARARLFDAVGALQASGQPIDATASDDARVWSEAIFKSINTSDAAEAVQFLGDDELARTAVAAADAMAQAVAVSGEQQT
jgi:hypothetical protein